MKIQIAGLLLASLNKKIRCSPPKKTNKKTTHPYLFSRHSRVASVLPWPGFVFAASGVCISHGQTHQKVSVGMTQLFSDPGEKKEPFLGKTILWWGSHQKTKGKNGATEQLRFSYSLFGNWPVGGPLTNLDATVGLIVLLLCRS